MEGQRQKSSAKEGHTSGAVQFKLDLVTLIKANYIQEKLLSKV